MHGPDLTTSGRLVSVILSLVVVLPLRAADPAPEAAAWRIGIEAGQVDRSNLPIHTLLQVPDLLADGDVKVTLADGGQVAGQLGDPTLLRPAKPAAGKGPRDLVFVLPRLPAGEGLEVTAEITPRAESGKAARLCWAAEPGGASLMLAGKPLLRYEMPAYDASGEAARVASYKPFHHVFDPATGIRLTKGPGGQYTHHRGIFFGYNRIAHGEGKQQNSDCWHCTGKSRQEHRETLVELAGPVAARQRVAIEWIGSGGSNLLDEVREIEVVPMAGGTVIDFASQLTTTTPISLDGDPQHAGVHFRGSNEVHESTTGQTYYIRPDGKAEPGEFRNWPQNKTYVDAPWHAASFVVGGQRYTVLRANRPANPGQARMSERDYARFGSYFAHELEPGKPLEVGYRFWVQPGELTIDEATRIAADYASPARTTATRLEPAAR